jgi:4'-phosphopantetheinyl transferase
MTTFSPPPPTWELGPNDVHLWLAHLPSVADQLPRLEQYLSAEERERAQRFRQAADRHRYIVSHGMLRLLLARYLSADPAQLRFLENAFGKPRLDGPAVAATLCFNLSHSGEFVLLGITRAREIGVDVETVRPRFATLEVAERFFAPAEVTVLRSLPQAEQTTAFFLCWTRKEAFIKARGEGLSRALDKFEVAFRPEEPAALLWSADDPKASLRWSIRDASPAPGYAAAVVVDGQDLAFHCWQWTG